MDVGVARGELEQALASRRTKSAPKRLLLIGLGIAIAGGGAWFFGRSKDVEPRFVTKAITVGDVIETVQSTGGVKPMTEVQVGAQVSGRITKVFVDFNSAVKAGDVLAEIDSSLFGAQLDAIEAQRASARAAVARSEAQVSTTKLALDRLRGLVAEGIASTAELDAAQGSHNVATADLAVSRGQVEQLEAQLRSSRTNLAYTRIYSPIDGIVIHRAIDPGQTVAASFQAPTLFIIAEDLRKMRVLADIDEADVGKLSEGLPASVAVDAFPNERFAGSVQQIRYSAVNVAGVITYAAIIEVDNPDRKLRPGMTATVTIETRTAKGVRRLPSAALRFRPTPDEGAEPVPPPKLEPGQARIFSLRKDDKTEIADSVIVNIGISDGTLTELKSGFDGSEVIVDENDPKDKKGGRSPRLF